MQGLPSGIPAAGDGVGVGSDRGGEVVGMTIFPPKSEPMCTRCGEPSAADVHELEGITLPFSKVSRVGRHAYIPPSRGYNS